jgi:hypothetical protein
VYGMERRLKLLGALTWTSWDGSSGIYVRGIESLTLDDVVDFA